MRHEAVDAGFADAAFPGVLGQVLAQARLGAVQCDQRPAPFSANDTGCPSHHHLGATVLEHLHRGGSADW
jgi:hypothetical protein